MSAQNRARVRFRFVSWLLVVAAYVATPSVRADTSFCCPSDISGNGGVDGVDLSLVLTTWGSDGQQGLLDCDINDDGIVLGPDLAILLSGWGPCPLPCLKTVVSGRARFQDGSPATGAVVTTSFGPTTVTNSNGDFSMLIEAPSAKETLTVSIETDWNGLLHSAQRTELVLTFEGVTAVGTVVLTPTSICAASDWIAVGVRSAATNGEVRALCSFDDGGGAKLYAGGSFTILNGVPVNHIARWNGATWESVGAGFNWYVNALAVFDDGTGPALYAGGSFSGGLARWNGKSWEIVGGGVRYTSSDIWIPSVETLAVFDDGGGNALYVGGAFTRAGSVNTDGLARWDGNTWASLPAFSGFAGNTRTLSVFDAGLGNSLYASIDVRGIGGSYSGFRIVRWNGQSWDLSYGVMDAPIEAMTAFDFGSGPRLVAGGGFTFAAGAWARGIASWNGDAWEPVGGGLNSGGVKRVVPFTDEGGTSLFLSGGFLMQGSTALVSMARWDHSGWRPVGVEPNSYVVALIVHDSGGGPSLVAGGWFTLAGNRWSAGVSRWGCEP